MKKYSRLILFILIIIVSMTIVGCNSTDYQSSIFDDENEIVKKTNSYTYRSKKGTAEDDKINLEFASFTGKDTVYKIRVDKESKVTFHFDSKIDKGDFKVVVVTPHDKIINVLNGTERGSKEIILEEGTNRIKFLGRRAKGKIDIDIKK